jgi:hypothetical protein
MTADGSKKDLNQPTVFSSAVPIEVPYRSMSGTVLGYEDLVSLYNEQDV